MYKWILQLLNTDTYPLHQLCLTWHDSATSKRRPVLESRLSRFHFPEYVVTSAGLIFCVKDDYDIYSREIPWLLYRRIQGSSREWRMARNRGSIARCIKYLLAIEFWVSIPKRASMTHVMDQRLLATFHDRWPVSYGHHLWRVILREITNVSGVVKLPSVTRIPTRRVNSELLEDKRTSYLHPKSWPAWPSNETVSGKY